MKKIIALILVSILCLGMLASCGKDAGLDAAANYLDEIYEKKTVGGNDYDVVAKVTIEGTAYSVSWTVDNKAISIKESTKTGFYTVDLPDVNEAEAQYTLTATISNDKGKTVTKSYTYTLPVIDSTGITSTPVEGTAYKIFLLQGGMGLRYYALGSTQKGENKFVETTTNPKDGVDFYVEKSGEGYKIYTEINGVKNYLFAKVTKTVEDGTTKYSKFIGYNTAEGSVFTYNEAKGGVWTVTVDNLVYGVGTYGTYTTISLSDESYFTPDKVGTSQYVIQFMTSAHANTLEADKLPEANTDAKAILDQLYALADGESAKGNFKLTGKITALDNYNNPTFVVEGYESKPVYCYRLTDNRFVVGATITVSATEMKNYGGTYEFMNCTLESITGGGSDSGSAGSESTEEPDYDSDSTVDSDTTIAIGDCASSNSWENSVLYDKITMGNGTTVEISVESFNKDYGRNSGKYYTSDTTWRIYQNETPSIVITAAEGKTIATVKVTYLVNKGGVLTQGETQIASDSVVTVNATSITFGVGNTGDATNGQVKITGIEITYAN